jgi:surfactin family lipopeptide synthetase A
MNRLDDLRDNGAGGKSRSQDSRNGSIETSGGPSALTGLVDELTPEQLAALSLLLSKESNGLERNETEDRLVVPASREGSLPLSFAQQRLWFLDQLDPGSAAYNIPCAVRLIGQLDVEALGRSLNEIIARHEILRTCFPSKDGEPRQEIREFCELQPDFIDLKISDEAERQEKQQDLLRTEARRGFDLWGGPLIRATLIRLAEDRHVLIVNMHHIVSDGWSIEVMVGEFTQLYEAFTEGRESSLKNLDIQYADYAIWQRAWLQGEILETQLQYWKEKLDGVATLELPTDRARPAAASDRGASESFRFPKEATMGLRQLSQREGVTLFISLLTGFHILLARYSGQSDIAVGTPIAGRNRREIEGLIGFFVNTLVMRVDLGGDPTVRELLGRVRESALGAYAHQDLPFEKLVEELQPNRSLNHTPLFQVMFAFQSAPLPVAQIGSVTAEVLEIEATASKFDLLLSLRDTGNDISGVVGYNSDLFNRSTIQRLIQHFQVLIQGLIAHPNQRFSLLPLMSETEKRMLVWNWNKTETEFDRDICIHQVIEGRAQEIPDATAVIFEHQRISYSELERRANQVASFLRRRGVGPEMRVGLMVERSIELVVWMIGILKAGGAYTPIDPAYPKLRRELIIEDSMLELIVSDQTMERLEGLTQLILTQAVRDEVERESPGRAESGVTSGNLAYVIYTSGSTGRPKGVALAHRGVIALMKWAERAYSREELAGVLAATSICFDLSVYEILVALGLGGKVILGRSGVEMREEINSGEVVQLNTVPSLIEEVLREGELNPSVKVVNLAGEALSRGLVEQVYKRSRVERVVNLYGPSEDTTYTTMEEEPRGSQERVTIGRAIENTRIYIADEKGELTPIGVRGEIYIGSESLARCYIGNGWATGEQFVPEAWSGSHGERAYKTGDIGRYLDGGDIEYLGRKDHQVKIRGHRIELGEIESAINEHPLVEQVIVLAREDELGDKRLVGYVVGRQQLTNRQLREHLQSRLPDYMTPGAFVHLEKMPLTPNGKLDRKALPPPDAASVIDDYIAPATTTEITLAQIWANLLKIDPNVISASANLFELGGHSLLLAKLVSEIRNEFAVELPIREVMRWPQLNQIAEQIFEAGLRSAVYVGSDYEVGPDEMEVTI